MKVYNVLFIIKNVSKTYYVRKKYTVYIVVRGKRLHHNEVALVFWQMHKNDKEHNEIPSSSDYISNQDNMGWYAINCMACLTVQNKVLGIL